MFFFQKTSKAAEYFSKSTAVEYLLRVKQRLNEESERARLWLAPETKSEIENVVKEEMIEKYKEQVVRKTGSGVDVLLRNRSKNDLRIVYEVLHRVPGALAPTIAQLESYILEEGESIIKNEKSDDNPVRMVEQLIGLRVYYDELLNFSFSMKMV